MAVSGSWASKAVTSSEYAGATRWGTGINPVHAIRDAGPGRGPNKEPLGTSGGEVPEALDDDLTAYGYAYEDMQFYAGEDYRYVQVDHPNLGNGSTGRADRNGRIMAPDGTDPGPAGYPPWGAYYADPDDEFPLSGGPPGGAELRSRQEGAQIENARAIAVPTRGLSGGWLNKAHGDVAEALTSDPSQYEMTTSMIQLHKTQVNDAAVIRATDDPRSPIETRLTGQKVKVFAMSSGMGGGPGTPDMAPVAQDLPFRPWYFRHAAVPPPPDTMYGTMTSFTPLERVPPVDAGELVTQTETGQDITMADVATDQDYYA
jgi:hypothetical protein